MISFFSGNALAGRAEGNGFADSWMWLGEMGGLVWIHYLSYFTVAAVFLQLSYCHFSPSCSSYYWNTPWSSFIKHNVQDYILPSNSEYHFFLALGNNSHENFFIISLPKERSILFIFHSLVSAGLIVLTRPWSHVCMLFNKGAWILLVQPVATNCQYPFP